MTDYWTDAVEAALSDAGIVATAEQIDEIAGAMEVSAENYGMAHGHHVAGPGPSPAQVELARLKSDLQQKEEWEARTRPCEQCLTTGWLQDMWGREVICHYCEGKGRV